MMLHLGGNDLLPLTHIVAILGARAAQAKDTAACLGYPHLPEDARSVILIHTHGKSSIRLSSLSPQTLLRRQRMAGDAMRE